MKSFQIKFLIYFCIILIIFGGAFLIYHKEKTVESESLKNPDLDYLVKFSEVEDFRPVAAVTDPVKTCFARARISGTLNAFKVTEGDKVTNKQVLAEIYDPKIDSQISSLKEKINSALQQKQNAEREYKRYLALIKDATVSRSDFERFETAYKVAENNLKSLEFDLQTLENQQADGAVLSPTNGKVLNLIVAGGSVVMPGENLVELTCKGLILKIRVPEAISEFIQLNDKIKLDSSEHALVSKIYPKIENGNLLIEAELSNIQSAYVGKLLTAYIKAGTHKGFLIPEQYFIYKNGLNSLKLKNIGEIIVQSGAVNNGMIEVFSGLKENDILVLP